MSGRLSQAGGSAPAPIAIIAITPAGVALGGRLVAALADASLYVPARLQSAGEAAAPGVCRAYPGRLAALLPGLFAGCRGLVAVFSVGALVRLLAPLLRDKARDPAVVVIDEAGRFAIPVLSGHLGGANALATRIATALGATAVLTTASDVRGTLAVDLLGRAFGWRLEASTAAVLAASMALVEDEPVLLVQQAGRRDWWRHHAGGRSGPLPSNLDCRDDLTGVDPAGYRAVLWIGHGPPPAALAAGPGPLVVYRPPDGPGAAGGPDAAGPGAAADLFVGLGCDRGTAEATLGRALDAALASIGATRARVAGLATIDLKADEPGLLALAARHGWALRCFSAAQLAAVPVPQPSATVLRHTGTPSVSAAAARLVASLPAPAPMPVPVPVPVPGGPRSAGVARPALTLTGPPSLLVEKYRLRDAAGHHVTVSIARHLDD